MSVIDRLVALRAAVRPSLLLSAAGAVALSATGIALAADIAGFGDARVRTRLRIQLPKTQFGRVDCAKIDSLCEVTAGANLFYVDRSARYLIIGRVYDMQARQDLTAARLLEINPDMLVGGAAKANATANQASGDDPELRDPAAGAAVTGVHEALRPTTDHILSLADLPKEGAITWGNKAATQTITVFTDFRCGYCRALTNVLRGMNIRVIERPISVLGSRDLATQVYCARDQEAALRAAYAGEPITVGAACDTSGLDANERFARAHGLSGTPVIVRSDGAMLEGYRPRQFLEAWIKGAKS